MTSDTYLSTRDVAARLRVSQMTVLRLITAGTLPATRVGRQYRVAVVDLDEFLDAHLVAVPS
jgi:excisionase family DNA binding protein